MVVKYIRLESSANVAKRIEISNRIEILIPLTNKKIK